jgi:hypothetical protein
VPAKVPGDKYSGMDCAGLKGAKQQIAARQGDLAPTLIPVKDEQTREQELSHLRGEAAAIDRVSTREELPLAQSTRLTYRPDLTRRVFFCNPRRPRLV